MLPGGKNPMYLKYFTLSSLHTAPSCHLHNHTEEARPGSVVRSHSLNLSQTAGPTPGFSLHCSDSPYAGGLGRHAVGLGPYMMRCSLSRLSRIFWWVGRSSGDPGWLERSTEQTDIQCRVVTVRGSDASISFSREARGVERHLLEGAHPRGSFANGTYVAHYLPFW